MKDSQCYYSETVSHFQAKTTDHFALYNNHHHQVLIFIYIYISSVQHILLTHLSAFLLYCYSVLEEII